MIDILLAVNDPVSLRGTLVSSLERQGYENVPQEGDAFRFFFRKGDPPTDHPHIVKNRSWVYDSHVLFREYLMEHPSATEQHECRKRVHASRHRTDREA